MDRSILGLPDPVAGAPNGERRRSVRQKLHTPVYASFNGPQTGMIVDLSELLDLHEDGFAVQTSERLEVNRAVTGHHYKSRYKSRCTSPQCHPNLRWKRNGLFRGSSSPRGA